MKKYLPFMFSLWGIYCVAFGQSAWLTDQQLKKVLGNIPAHSYQVIATLPHDPRRFTEGLEYNDPFLYESTGLYGESKLYKSIAKTGELIQKTVLPNRFFGEGITLMHQKIVQLTWKENTGFIYDKDQLSCHTFAYTGEGWGLTHNAHYLIMSNGTATLAFINPETLKIDHTLKVTANQTPVALLNELEYIHDKIYANVWPTSIIIILSAHTGNIEGWLDLQKLKPPTQDDSFETVANGIAYNEKDNTLLVTGKNWPHLFVIKIEPN